MMRPVAETFGAVVDRLQARQPFAVSRWGDGEWAAVLGREGATVDGQSYTAALRADLTGVLLDRPGYWLGMQGFAVRRMGAEITAWLAARQLTFDWIDADLFARASLAGTLQPFVKALQGREVVLVGPARLTTIALFSFAHHVIIPDRECHAMADRIYADILCAIQGRQYPIVLLSAGPTANILIHRLWITNPFLTLIDCGSLWEPYVGLATRTYHARVLERVR